MNESEFESVFRKGIIEASLGLYRGGLRFRTFRESECNENYWELMPNGGFRIREGVKPSAGIRNIFRRARIYATECATAIVMVYYKATLDIYGDGLFDTTFPGLILMDWLYTDNKLGVHTVRNPASYQPGDCRYFKNPDVDPMTPEWQGENAIDLGDGTYWGHGIGIRNAREIIRALNRNRIPGSDTSAYLMDTVTLPDFNGLYRVYAASAPAASASEAPSAAHPAV